ncbi:MAG: MBL fold metallo-hydrolase [Terrimonas sp.]|nr:MBL fold metallo-hydrolase [Terrimonas sp.]
MFTSFGKNPSGEQLDSLLRSAQYSQGGFQNISPTEMMIKKHSLISMTWKFLQKPLSTRPPGTIPSVRTDLKSFDQEQPVIIWFGHSSYLIHINSKNILVDPVFSGHASPFLFGAKSFEGSDVYSVADLPGIDLLLITHDHYDHLDHRTVKELMPKVKKVCTSLGVGAHLQYWGYDKQIITEMDWGEQAVFFDTLQLKAAPARHFSGRSLTRNKTLWASYILEASDHKIYIGADSGYDSHFKKIGEDHGPFDLVLLETGQYHEDWPFIHMIPEEAVQAAIDLQAKLLMPVHWGKFALAFHDWDEPVKRVISAGASAGMKIGTPRIGEPLVLGDHIPDRHWWEAIAAS